MTKTDIKRLARKFDVNPSTVTGWLQSGMPDNIRKAYEEIVRLEHELYWAKREPIT